MTIQIRDPKPEIMRLEELASMVKGGEIKLPRFQRPFVWKTPDMLKLLDSIYNGYPIGSLLIWNSSQKLNSERSILGLSVDLEENSSFPTNYLLDGQQRLTTLCGALFWDGIENSQRWGICFDLDKEEFIIPKEPNLISLFPLNRLIKTADFIRQCMKFDSSPKKDRYYQVAERLLKSIKDYKIAVVKIGDMSIDEVAPIFERINSTGRKLTMVDLMMAATWSDQFDLTAEIAAYREVAATEGFDEIPDSVILRSFSAATGNGISKEDIQKLRGKNPKLLNSATQESIKALKRAIQFLKKEIGINDFSYLPYAFQFILLTEIFRLLPHPNEKEIFEIRKWFWATAITRYFTSANTGQMRRDVLAVRAFCSGETKSIIQFEEIDATSFLFSEFNLRNAISVAYAAFLGVGQPQKTIDGRPIDEGYRKTKTNKFFACLPNLSGKVGKLNLSMVIHPYQAFKEFDWRSLDNDVLESHYLQKIDFEKLPNSQNEFLNERAMVVCAKLQAEIGTKIKFSIPFVENEDFLIPEDDEDAKNIDF